MTFPAYYEVVVHAELIPVAPSVVPDFIIDRAKALLNTDRTKSLLESDRTQADITYDRVP